MRRIIPVQLDLTLPDSGDRKADAAILGQRLERAARQVRFHRLVHGYSVVETKRLMTPLPRITVPR